MISDGSIYGDSGRARKAHSRRLESLGLDLAPKSDPIISFGPEELKGIVAPHNDALLVTLIVANYDVARIFVDTGSSVNILFKRTLDQMKVEGFEFDPVSTPLSCFIGHAVQTIGQIMLSLYLGTGPHRITKMTCFTVVDSPSLYNGILGRPALADFRAVSSIYHQKLKYPAGNEVGAICGDQKSSRRCYVDEVKVEVKKSQTKVGMIRTEQRMISKKKVQLTSEEEPEMVKIGIQRNVRVAADLNPETKHDLLACLKDNSDVFTGPHKSFKGLVQRSWNTTSIYFLKPDQSNRGKGATYQRLMDRVFSAQVGSNVEVYVDDILVNYKSLTYLIADLRETFVTLRSYGLKLNPQKCTFGVRS
ncbi:uncharacterized protein LOC142510596 [Primulina tabacum]|uniref:uncharacterized protein LOC142510596 n=1 Tax=Primulina tabacum TaxID=48773 RepID=UPI003F59E734